MANNERDRRTIANSKSETENIALAEKLAHKLMQDHLEGKGKCPSVVLQHYLGLSGSAGDREKERQEANVELIQKKTDSIKLAEQSAASAEEAKEAIYNYRGGRK